jgi:hypothetical protein
MSYGKGEFGQRGFGGSSFEEGGPALNSSDPFNGETGILSNYTVTFEVESPAGLDEFSLNVDLDGNQAIVGGVFQSGYGGTIVYDPETTGVVTISTHPPFPGGSTDCDIAIEDLAGGGAFSEKSVYFPGGLSQLAVVGDVASLEHQWDTDSRTYSFWVKPGGGGGLLGKANTGIGNGLRLDLSGGGAPRSVQFGLVDPSGRQVAIYQTTPTLNDSGTWYHVALVVPAPANASTIVMYVNGSSVPFTTLFNNLAGGDNTTAPGFDFVLGHYINFTTSTLTGNLDEVAIYSSALSAGDVTALYNSGKPGDLGSLGSWASNIGWWRMGDGDAFPTIADNGNGTSNDGTMINMTAANIVGDVPGGPDEPTLLSFNFTVEATVIVSETLGISEAMTPQMDFNALVGEAMTVGDSLTASLAHGVTVSEALTLLEEVETGALNVTALDGSTIRASFPFELRFTGTGDLANFSVTPASAAAYGVSLVSVESGFNTFQTGSSGHIHPAEYALLGYDGPSPGGGLGPPGGGAPTYGPTFGSLEDGTSNVLWLGSTGTGFTSANVGDFVEILNGGSPGIYQVTLVSTEMYWWGGGDSFPIPIGEAIRVLLDRPLLLKHPDNGYAEGLCEYIGPTDLGTLWRINHPDITETDPAVEMTFLENRTNGESTNAADLAILPGRIVWVDHNTFKIAYGPEETWPPVIDAVEGDRLFAQVRVSPKLSWRHISGVQELTFKTTRSPGTKLTDGAPYLFTADNLFTKVTGEPVSFEAPFIVAGTVQKPRVGSAAVTEDGIVTVEYDQPMRLNEADILNTDDYFIGRQTFADELVEDATTAWHGPRRLYTFGGTGDKITLSLYAKARDQDYYSLSIGQLGGNANTIFDLSTGAIVLEPTNPAVVATRIEDASQVVGAGWYRISVTWIEDGFHNLWTQAYNTDSGNGQYAGTPGLVATEVFGAQLTKTPGPIPYFKTEATASDRNLLTYSEDFDNAAWTTAGGTWNSSAATGPLVPAPLKRIFALSDRAVGLELLNLDEGTYTVSVSTSTPTDVAGNPLDPTWNTAVFTAGAPALTPRSIFTDKGPISKPEEILQSGTGGTITSFTEITLPGALLTSNEVGKRLRLSGGTLNSGEFRITSVVSTTKCIVQASFTVPDAFGHTWVVFDPRNGQVADDPTDVTVRINGSPVTPEAVVGLLGQIVLNAAPAPADDVQVDYSWCCNPTVELRRLNSREFRLNGYGRDLGYPNDWTQHKYRFNNVLVRPSDYEPDNMDATLDQPLEREMHYRAYERLYTPVLNDPTLLLLNSPIHRIAYAPAQRYLEESFVTYEGIGLPEANTSYPWERVGTGQASSASGVLTVEDDSTGVFPTGQPVFWTRSIDLTFDYVFAMSWRFSLDAVPTYEGVFTGIAAGFSDDLVATVVGFIDDGGTKQIGILKRGSTDDPSDVTSWIGGLDVDGNPTDAPVDFDWSILHSYRVYQGLDRTIQVFVDGDLEPTLQVTRDDIPFLEELNAPFDEIQGVFFGSVSRVAESTSAWDFVRYLIQPGSPVQSSPSSFVSYEGNLPPEQEARPWTPVGFHGTETIISTDFLLLDATSATDVTTAGNVGLIGGDFRGFVRFEPLLTASSEVVLDVNLQLQTYTHGPDSDALMFAVDDGNRLMQVAFFPDFSTPKLSYGGRSFPEDFSPYVWSVMGTQTATMAGRVLQITDASVTDGRVYYIEDANPGVPFTGGLPSSEDRIIAADTDYILEFRCEVVSYTADGSGFCGAFAQVFDSSRAVGAMFTETGATKYVTLHADGVLVSQFAFDWDDGLPHTYRLSKSTSGDLVSLFIDGAFVGSAAYSSFPASVADPVGQVSFGSSTPASMQAESVVDWSYCNAWRVRADQKRFVGLWKGYDADSLLGYHLPVKASGRGAQAVGNTLIDGNADFLAAGVVAGDPLVVDAGDNRGVYEVAAVVSAIQLTLTVWPSQPSLVDYRIIKETDWSTYHKYRLYRDSTGSVSLLLDAESLPLIQVGYNSLDLPVSGLGIVSILADDLPAIAWGSFGPEDLSQSSWDYVRYGLTRSVTEMRIAPHHEVLNQWNVMHSPERLFTQLPHTLTDFKSSSTGQPPKTDPDFLADPALEAWTKVNEGTPIVPQTQSFEVRAPFPVQESVSGLNRPEDVLNSDGDFTLNDGALRFKLIVPDDVLYSCLDIIEQQDDGATDVLTPFCDGCSPHITGIRYTDEVCLTYDGSVLPEDDASAATEWGLVSDTPGDVSTTAFAGILTYSTAGSKTVYRNDTPLPDAVSLQTEARFRIKLLEDWSAGTDDTQVRFGISAPGMTLALAFVTIATGERLVLVIDQNSGAIVGGIPFDFLDGLYHDYRLVRDPSAGTVQVFIDS